MFVKRSTCGVLLILLFVRITIVVQRDYRVFLTERPPPTESEFPVEFDGTFAARQSVAERLHEFENLGQWLACPSIVGRHGDIAAELQHSFFGVRIETGLFQHQHSIGLTEDVVVQRALRYVVAR